MKQMTIYLSLSTYIMGLKIRKFPVHLSHDLLKSGSLNIKGGETRYSHHSLDFGKLGMEHCVSSVTI